MNTYVLEEDFEDTTGLLVDETRDTLDTATAGKTTNSGLGNTCQVTIPLSTGIGIATKEPGHTLNVITKNLAMTLSTTLSETLQMRTALGQCSVISAISAMSTHLATFSTARHVYKVSWLVGKTK